MASGWRVRCVLKSEEMNVKVRRLEHGNLRPELTKNLTKIFKLNEI